MKSLIFIISILSLISLFARSQAHQDACLQAINSAGCGTDTTCLVQNASRFPAECRDVFEDALIQADGMKPCNQEKKKFCPSGECTQAQVDQMSAKCKQEYMQNYQMEKSAEHMAGACDQDFKNICGVDFRSPSSDSNDRVTKCIMERKSQFSAECKKSMESMFGGSF